MEKEKDKNTDLYDSEDRNAGEVSGVFCHPDMEERPLKRTDWYGWHVRQREDHAGGSAGADSADSCFSYG